MGIFKRFFQREDPVEPKETIEADPRVSMRIVGEYGEILEKHSKGIAFGIPESVLPYSKGKIKLAIRMCILLCSNNAEMIEQLRVGYMNLASFVPDDIANADKADLVTSFDPKDPESLTPKELSDMKLISDLLSGSKAILDEQRVLLREIDEFVSLRGTQP